MTAVASSCWPTPASLGHVFDPLTVFWCFDSGGDLACVVAEVHNTYGERHAYLLRPDHSGTARTGKELYVSPFNDVSGLLHAAVRACPRSRCPPRSR